MNRSILALAAALLLAAPALASDARAVFGGKVLVSDARIPTRESVAALKKRARRRIARSDDGSWHIFFAAFFKRAPNDKVVHIRLYDLTRKDVLQSIDQHLDDPHQRAFASMVAINPGAYDVRDGAHLMLEIAANGRVLARGTFALSEATDEASGD